MKNFMSKENDVNTGSPKGVEPQLMDSVKRLKGMLPAPKQAVSLEEMDKAILKGMEDVQAGRVRLFDANYIEGFKARIRKLGSTV